MGKTSSYEFGREGWFDLDIIIALACLDEEGTLRQKFHPVKLNGRRYLFERSEARMRVVFASCSFNNPRPEIMDLIDEEPDLVGEHMSQKALRRKHRAAQRYRKVRQEYAAPGNFDLRAFKKEARRRRRRQLNGKAVAGEKDVVRKYRSTFSDAEPYSIKGMKLLDGHVSGFGSFDL